MGSLDVPGPGLWSSCLPLGVNLLVRIAIEVDWFVFGSDLCTSAAVNLLLSWAVES